MKLSTTIESHPSVTAKLEIASCRKLNYANDENSFAMVWSELRDTEMCIISAKNVEIKFSSWLCWVNNHGSLPIVSCIIEFRVVFDAKLNPHLDLALQFAIFSRFRWLPYSFPFFLDSRGKVLLDFREQTN